MSAYSNNSKKISQFTKGTAITNDVQYSSLQGGINKTFTQQQIIDDFQDVYGASLRTFEFESELVVSDIALGEYAIVEENNYAFYKVTNAAAVLNDVELDSGLVATFEYPSARLKFDSVADMKLRSLEAGSFVTTDGYYGNKTDGGATYLIKTAAEAATDGDVIDTYGNHTLANGNVAIISVGSSILATQFGAVSDASFSGGVTTNSLPMLNAAHAYCNTINGELIIDGQFGITGEWVLTSGTVKGLGMTTTGVYKSGDFSGIRFLAENGIYEDFFCRGVDGNEASDSGHGFVSIDGQLAKRMRMSRLFAADHGGNGFDMGGGNLAEYTSLLSVSNAGWGFRFGGFDANACTAINLDARNNTLGGVWNNGAYNFIALGGYTTNNGGYGWLIEENDGKYFGIGGESDTPKTLKMGSGKARNYIVLGVSGDYDDDSSGSDANTIIGTRDNTMLYARQVTIRNGDSNEGGVLLSSGTTSGSVQLTKDDATRNLVITMAGTSAVAHVDMSPMGTGKGLIVRDTTDGNRYLIRVTNGVVNTVNLGP